MSAVICKLKLLNKNELVKYLQNYKCYNVDYGHFRKQLKSSIRHVH